MIRALKIKNLPGGRLRKRREELLLGVFLLKPLDPTFGVDDLLRSCEERMAIRADIKADFASSRFRFERGPACAGDVNLFIFWMNCAFHGSSLYLKRKLL
jgi:hypothetical protein